MLRSRWVPVFFLVLVGGLACEQLAALANNSNAEGDDEENPSQPRGARRGRRGRARRPRAAGVAGAIVPPVGTPSPGVPGIPAVTVPSLPTGTSRLRVVFLDIGQGDAALLQSGVGHNALIDAGPPEGRTHLREVLTARGVTSLDWMLLTHPHLDHLGGAQSVLDTVRVGSVVDPAFPHPIATYNRLLARIQELSIPFVVARTNGTLSLGAGISIELLLPHEPFLEHSRSDANANSIVARVTVGALRLLFTGDSERETEERLLAENPSRVRAQVLKVAHHGSRFASSPAFLQAVSPSHAVISCATGNEYGHPHVETLQALSQRGTQVFRTDLHGDIELSTDGVGLRFTTARTPDPSALLVGGVRETAQ